MIKFNRRFGLIITLLIAASLVLAACGGSSGSNQPVDVKVTVSEFTITSSLTTFQQGVPYHFTVTNNGTVDHEVYIMPPTTDTLTTDQVKQMALAGVGSDQLKVGATVSFDYTFTKAYPEGSLEFACHLPGHYEAGMHLPIVVK
jgi:uncharacterized cupredoxin-like copper-binding protein